ncbi:hypothetical protein ACFQ60_03470 [Streptomyces zhihengii]
MLERDVGQPTSVTRQDDIGGADATTLITDLPYGPKAAEVAREAVAVALHGTEVDLLEDARLITSELATNAFASGKPPLVLCVDRMTPTTGGLEVEITVTDGGSLTPRRCLLRFLARRPNQGEGWSSSGPWPTTGR